MKVKKFSVIKILIFLLLFLFIFNSVPQSSDTVLIKIEKTQKVDIPAQLVPGLRPMQELETCWIVETSRWALSRLVQSGISCEVLDTDPAGKLYYLVLTPSPEQIEDLKNFGEVRIIENQVCLFWSGDKEAREVLPAYFEVKSLPSSLSVPLEVRTEITSKEIHPERKPTRLISPDPRISLMVNQVSKENLSFFIQSLQNFETRYASTLSCELSGDYLYNFFYQAGVESEYDPFKFSSNYSSRNVIGTIPGQTAPECVVIVCAHYDSTSNDKYVLAPGADDNGSGTAAVMEMARVMNGNSFDFTLKFICFSAEEWGLYGSRHYAQEAMLRGEKIIGVINLDMIGYVDRWPEDLDVIVNQRSEWLADKLISSVNSYAPLNILKTIDASATYSDHSPFWDQGFSALLGIEDYFLNNPYYHKTSDTLDKLNMDFATAVTKASLAAAADLAQPESTPLTPSGVSAHSQISSSLFFTYKTTYLDWNPGPGQIVGYNIYCTTSTHTNYRKINSSPLSQTSYKDEFLNPDTTYFYVITAVDSLGRESNYSEEVRDDEDNQEK